MRVGLKVSMWKRYDVFEIFAAGAQRLKNDFGVITFVVGSEGDASKNLCQKWGFNYIEYPNRPFGAKLNACLKEMRNHNLDYIINMGSDDIICNNLMKNYLKYMDQGYDVIGLMDTYYVDLIKKKLLYSYGYVGTKRRGEPIGMGRAISARILDSCDWRLWEDNQNFGSPDKAVTVKINKFKKQKLLYLSQCNCFAADMKSSYGLHSYSMIKKIIPKHKELNISVIKDYLPEYNLILNFKEE